MSEPLVRRERSILSPLRYPGAKRRFWGYVAETLKLNGLKPKLFVEPFAGGASVALELLNRGLVKQIALGELDPLVAAFWKAVKVYPERLISRLSEERVTLERWHHYRNCRSSDPLDLATKCLFLNRTSFSGILSPTAGPIGGQTQGGGYKIDCRFPKDTLTRRIRQAARLADKIRFVHAGDYRETIRKATRYTNIADVFFYLDPPFYAKADRLYTHWFKERDHVALRDRLARLRSPWLLSYDPAAQIRRLYAGHRVPPAHVDLLYSASAGCDMVKAQELLISNLPTLPTQTRLWRSSKEWAAPLAGRPTAPGGPPQADVANAASG